MEIEGHRLHRWGDAPRWEAFTLPDPGRGEVLIQVEACGVGLTVLNCMNGALADAPELLPVTPGHEVVGRIAAVGDGVDPVVSRGSRVSLREPARLVRRSPRRRLRALLGSPRGQRPRSP
jgi:D-arabinose 1-dehydrogenase-like Zn-dependent alcohol dehydrogenase